MMRSTSAVRIALLVLTGVVFGCAREGSQTSPAHAEPDGPEPAAARAESKPSAPAPPAQERAAPAGAVASATGAVAKPRPHDAAVRPAGDGTNDQADSGDDWTMSIEPDATVVIRHRQALVAKAVHVFWGENAGWVRADFQAGPIHDGEAAFTGEVKKLDLKAVGSIRRAGPNSLRVDYNFHAARSHANVFGGIIGWNLMLRSPSFDRPPADPVLLPDRTGWSWQLSPGRSIVVRFDEPLDKEIFERNQKNDIRTFLYAGRIERGQRHIGYTIEIPEGGRIAPTDDERYGAGVTSRWFPAAMSWDGSPVDVSALFAAERPAGKHGFVQARGEDLVFEDGTPARFWGTNVAAGALFDTPRENVRVHAHRLAKLGFNLVRIVHIDAPWCKPNIFGDGKQRDTRHLDRKSFDSIDWWIKCLEDEGIYVWLDLIYLRTLTSSDGVKIGAAEIIQGNKGIVHGFNYLNRDVVTLMEEFQQRYLNHVNPYTKHAYKSDPAVIGVMITNENDLTTHFGYGMQDKKKNPVHSALLMEAAQAFARESGLPLNRISKLWEPPGKIFLNELEHRFNETMIADLRSLGVRPLITTTSAWGLFRLFCLPSLTDGDIIDAHSYGKNGELDHNPRYEENFLMHLAVRVAGKPVSMTEWGVPYPHTDRFTTPLYMASVAALQGWNAPMQFCYSQAVLEPMGKAEWQRRIDSWSSYEDPAICGVMPAAAVAFRKGHIRPARNSYCLQLPADTFFSDLGPPSAATIRTLVEQSRMSIAMPAVKELPWLSPSKIPDGVTVLTDPGRDMIPPGESSIRSDTGELTHDWKSGIQTINTPRTQAVQGWIGGKTLKLGSAVFQFENPKATVALTSLDDRPLSSSQFILITAVARSVASDTVKNLRPFLSEPVVGEIRLDTSIPDLQLISLTADGKVRDRLTPARQDDGVSIRLPAGHGTHWYLLRAAGAAARK